MSVRFTIALIAFSTLLISCGRNNGNGDDDTVMSEAGAQHAELFSTTGSTIVGDSILGLWKRWELDGGTDIHTRLKIESNQLTYVGRCEPSGRSKIIVAITVPIKIGKDKIEVLRGASDAKKSQDKECTVSLSQGILKYTVVGSSAWIGVQSFEKVSD